MNSIASRLDKGKLIIIEGTNIDIDLMIPRPLEQEVVVPDDAKMLDDNPGDVSFDFVEEEESDDDD